MKNKTILIYPENQKLHTLYDSSIKLLSKKYNIVYNPQPNKNEVFARLKGIFALRYLYHKFIRRFISFYDFRSQKISSTKKIDMIFSQNQIPPTEKDYVLDLELITALSGYNYQKLDKKEIKNSFEKKNCRTIICWNKFSYDTLIKTIDCSNFFKKIEIIPFAIKSENIKKRKHNGVNLLFVSSVNNPDDFELKGGIMALEAYSLLIKKYKNLKFFIRANINEKIVEKYKSLPGVVFLREYLSEDKMKELFDNTDLLLEPIPGINLLLDCMNFSIPAISFDYLSLPEMIINKKTGFLISSKEIFGTTSEMDSYLRNMHMNCLRFYETNLNKKFAPLFADKASLLIEKKALRKKMGKNAKKLLSKKEKYSLEKRNRKLSQVIDRVLQ